MKRSSWLRAVLSPLAATLVTGAVAFIVSVVAGSMGIAGFFVPLASGLAAGTMVSILLGLRLAAANRGLEEILAAADKDVIDLSALLPDYALEGTTPGTHPGANPGEGGTTSKAKTKVMVRSGAINSLLSIAAKLNINLVDISRAALKFGLFSQDISFSSAHLAELSHEQAEAMGRIRALADQYGSLI